MAYRIARLFADPYLTLLALMGLSVILGRFRSRPGGSSRVPFLLWFLLWMLGTPAVAYVALGSLEWQHSAGAPVPDNADVVIVLGGGALPPTDEDKESRPSDSTVRRCLHAAELLEKHPRSRAIVCGGAIGEDAVDSEAEVMKRLLARLGIARSRVLVETKSQSTYENVRNAHEIIERAGFTSPVLVTDAWHLPRAMRCCKEVGFEPTPSGCGRRATGFKEPWATAFLPQSGPLADTSTAVKEWVGVAWYKFKGRN